MPLEPARTPALRGLPVLLASLLLLAPAALRAEEGPPTPAPAAGLTIGVHPLLPDCVVDADTLRLPKPHRSVRILGIDAEEVFKNEQDRAASEADFAAYAKAKRADHPRPVKYGTPAGEAAKAFVQRLVEGAGSLRLERDEVGARERGTFGRLLAHVWIVRAEGDVLLAEAVIRAGHSPYFTKYGRSKRFDARFRAAEAEAREAQRGIWGSEGPAHYPDYDERLAWWHARADQLQRWQRCASRPDHVTLGMPGADEALQARVGAEAVVFGPYERELPLKSSERRIFLLSHEPRRGFALVVEDPLVAKAFEAKAAAGGYLTVRGKVTLYEGKPQMVLESATQISVP